MRWGLGRGLLALLSVGLAACEPRAPEPPAAPGEGAVAAPPAGAPGTVRSLELRGLGGRRFLVTGSAPEGVPSVEVSVEDGHNILYGPETVPVEAGRFSVEIEVGESAAEQVFAYLTTPDGEQLVVPLQLPAGER